MSREAEHTEDGRYLAVGGRRRRVTDPRVPAERRAELRSIPMAWRHEVRRTDGAKVALGERGTPWCEQFATGAAPPRARGPRPSQGLRPTAPYSETALSWLRGGTIPVLRQRWITSTPGSTRSSPSKNRAISARERGRTGIPRSR